MARPRTPAAKAEVTGAAQIHPGRFNGRKEPQSTPIGNAPSWMDKDQRAAWESYRAELPWLMEAHRGLLEIAAKLRARLWTDPDMGITAMNQLRMCQAQLGGTPADMSKVAIPDGQDEDPAAEFIN